LYFSVSVLVVQWGGNISAKTDSFNDDGDDDNISNNNNKNNNSYNSTSGNLMFYKEQNGVVRWWTVGSGLVSRKEQSFNSGCSCSKSRTARHCTARQSTSRHGTALHGRAHTTNEVRGVYAGCKSCLERKGWKSE